MGTVDNRQLINEFWELTFVTRKALCPVGTLQVDIPIMQLMVLATVGTSSSCLNMTQVANEICVSNQQLTKLVKELQKKGLIMQTTNPANRRAMLLSLTQAGKEFLTHYHARFADAVLPNLQGITPEQRQLAYASILSIKEVMMQLSKNKG